MNKQDFSIIKRTKSFSHAFRGIGILLKTTPNFWLHILIGTVLVILGVHYHIAHYDWMFLLLSIGLVLVTEAVNTAIEIDIDLTSPEYHPFARDTKDVAAGVVLISGFILLAVSIIIFLPKIVG
ncbi:MAG: diacylglycerol kinase family protein [bacterium]